MKNFVDYIVAPCTLIISFLVQCNSDDIDRGQEEEFLSAQIDGTDFMVDRSLGLCPARNI